MDKDLIVKKENKKYKKFSDKQKSYIRIDLLIKLGVIFMLILAIYVKFK